MHKKRDKRRELKIKMYVNEIHDSNNGPALAYLDSLE